MNAKERERQRHMRAIRSSGADRWRLDALHTQMLEAEFEMEWSRARRDRAGVYDPAETLPEREVAANRAYEKYKPARGEFLGALAKCAAVAA
mgnify:CR=1 FL=1